MLADHPRLRLTIYLTALALGAASFFVSSLVEGDLGTAFTNSSGYLMAAALGVAASNTPSRSIE